MQEQINQAFAYLHSLWRYRWSALVIAWLVAIPSWMVVYTLPDQYQASASVFIDTDSTMKPLLQGLAVDNDATDDIDVVTRLLLSRPNLLSVMRDTDMDLHATTEEEKEIILGRLANSITLKSGAKDRQGWRNSRSNIYEISYVSNSADLSYQVVSLLLNTMIENTLSVGRTDTLMAQKFLDTQIAEHEKRLNMAEAKLADFKKHNLGLMPGEQGSYYMRLQRAEEQIQETKSQLKLAKQRYDELRRQLLGESPILESGESTANKLRILREQLADLESRFTQNHPDVMALRAQIADLEESRKSSTGLGAMEGDLQTYNPVYQELKVQESKAKIEIGALELQLAEQQGQLNKLTGMIDAMPKVEAELSRLNRDYVVTKERYLSLVERRESARLAQEVGQSNSEVTFRVIEPPVVPIFPIGPDRLLLLSAGFIFALAAGLGWSVLRYLLHPTFDDYKQLRAALTYPVLGTVSLYRTPEHRKSRRTELMIFLTACFFLLIGYAGVVMVEESASAWVRSIVADTELTDKI